MNNRKYKNRVNGVGFRVIETGEIFETRTQCAEYLNVNPSMITMYLNGQVKSCRGYHIEVVEIDFDHPLNDDVLHELYEMFPFHCEWRDHPYIPDLYVSDAGLIVKNKNGKLVYCKWHKNNNGYWVVSVDDYRNRKSKNSNHLVQRIVAETFIPNPENKPEVNHDNGNKSDNRVSNLYWTTKSENMIHAYKNGLRPTEEVMILETGEIFKSASDCARAIGGTVSGIHDCKTGRQRQHRGYHFRFPENGEFRFDISEPRLLGICITDRWTGEEAYFSDIQELTYELHIPRERVVDALLNEDNIARNYIIEPAGREEAILYADEDNKFLSWLRIGIL
jgi:hypothetical protein